MRGIRKYAVYDIESYAWTEFKLLGLYDGESYTTYGSVQDFLSEVLRKKYRGYTFFAHNSGKFDKLFLLKNLLREKYYLKLINVGSSILKMSVKDSHKHVWNFSDSYKLLPSSLRKLSESFGVSNVKQDLQDKYVELEGEELLKGLTGNEANQVVYNYFLQENIDYKKSKHVKAKIIREYLEYDVKGLFQVIEKFKEWFDGVPLSNTVAQQSLNTWKSMYKPKLVKLPVKVYDFVRNSYFGGRTEVFTHKIKRGHYYDYSSLYPSVMIDHIPYNNPYRTREIKEFGFYDVLIRVPKTHIPFIPKIVNGKLCFPHGTWRGTYTGIELLKLGLSNVLKVFDGWSFNSEPLFADYVEKFYNIKNNSPKKSASYMISKLLLNSLYGKFGQRPDKECIVQNPNEVLGLIPFMEDFGLYLKKSSYQSTFMQPQISSYITAKARLKLFSGFEEAGLRNVYYCDTDSIVTDKALKTGHKLGDLEEEHEVKEGIFLRPKFYAFINGEDEVVIRAKGYTREMLKKVSYDSFEKALNNDYSDFEVVQQRFGSFRESLKRNKDLLVMIERKRSVRTPYNKRVSQGLNTLPLEVKEN